MPPITYEELVELFKGKTREERLEMCLRQFLGVLDTPVRRRKQDTQVEEAICMSRHIIPWDLI